jgi:glycolate oxidase
MLIPVSNLIGSFIKICGLQYVIYDLEELLGYQSDQTLDLKFVPDIVVKPNSTEEISQILKICNEFHIPVTPRGGGSGVSGGALAVRGGVMICTERLNSIIEINSVDKYVIAEAGVVTNDLCKAVLDKNLYFPIAPSSGDFSFLGGNVAHNSGSINSCKYGKTSDYVLNLEVVLATGQIMWTGTNVKKSSTGFDLTHLFVGSEGLLGIITKVVYKLLPKMVADFNAALLCPFASIETACSFLLDLKQLNLSPAAGELIGRNATELTYKRLKQPGWVLRSDVEAIVIVQLQDSDFQKVETGLQSLMKLLESASPDVFVGSDLKDISKIWQLRMGIGEALIANGRKYRDVDVCIPLMFLNDFIVTTEEICKFHETDLYYFGHGLDGNLHMMLSIEHEFNFASWERIEKAADQIYSYAISKGGVISGEHGIGFIQKKFMHFQFSNDQLITMKNIKKALDPNLIMNPGKYFQD